MYIINRTSSSINISTINKTIPAFSIVECDANVVSINSAFCVKLQVKLNFGEDYYLKSCSHYKPELVTTDSIEDLEKELSDLKKAFEKEKEESDPSKKIEQLENDVKKYKKFESFKKKTEEKDKEIASLKSEVEASKTENDRLKSAIEDLIAKIEELTNAKKEADDKIEAMKSEFNSACKELGIGKKDGKWYLKNK